MLQRRSLFKYSLAGALGAASITRTTPLFAQNYPSKPVKLVIPFGAGGITDVVGRMIGKSLGDAIGQTMVIENKPGAGGNIAAQYVAQSASDGYTLLLGTVGTQVVNRLIYPKLNYKPDTFEPVSLATNSPYVLAIGKIDGIDSIQSLIKYAKNNPGKLNFGSAGNGSSPHLGIELFKQLTQTEIVHVPFKSGAEAVNAALSGQVQIVIDAIPVIKPHAISGRLKILAIAAHKRNPAIADIPTSAEAGLPNFLIGSWNAIVAPSGTSAASLAILRDAMKKVLTDPAIVEKLAEVGIDPMPTGLDAYRQHLASETKRWTSVIQSAHTKVD